MITKYLRENGYQGVIPEVLLTDVNLWIKYDVGPNSKLTEVQRRQLNEIGSRYYLDPIFRDYVNTKGKLNYRIYEDYTQMIEGGL